LTEQIFERKIKAKKIFLDEQNFGAVYGSIEFYRASIEKIPRLNQIWTILVIDGF